MYRTMTAATIVLLFVASTATAQTKLEFKYTEGSRFITNLESKTHQILTIAGMDIETKSEQFIVMSIEVGKRGEDGTLRVKQKFDHMQTNLNLPGGIEVQFDSGNPDKKADNEQFEIVLDILRAVAKSNWTLVLDKNNKIQKVEGAEKVLESLKEDVRKLVKSQFDAETLKQNANQELGKLPSKAVKKGDTWKRTEVLNLEAGQTLTFETVYKYLGTVEKDGVTLDKIESTSTSVKYEIAEDSPSPLKVTKSDLKIAFSTGTILFDRKKGKIVSESGKVHIKGDMTFSINGMELPGKLDLTIETKTTNQPS